MGKKKKSIINDTNYWIEIQKREAEEEQRFLQNLKCLNCNQNLIYDKNNKPLLTSGTGYACSMKCYNEIEKKKQYLLFVVLKDPELLSRWLRGDDFPKKREKINASRRASKRKTT